jgi:uncharacterized membrane protein YhaH (DUF805 family)
VHTRTNKALRLAFWVALLCLEICFVYVFYVGPQLQARNAPSGRWEQETPHGPLLLLSGIAFLVLLVAGTGGVAVMIWRGFKDLNVKD